MGSIFDTFATDSSKAKDGVVFDLDRQFTFEYEGKTYVTTFTMTHLGATNIAYQELLSRLQKPYIKRGVVKANSEQLIDISVRAFCGGILKGWENFEETRSDKRAAAIEEHGIPIVPYSYENSVAIMRSIPEFMDILAELATEPARFQTVSPVKQKQLGNEFQPITNSL